MCLYFIPGIDRRNDGHCWSRSAVHDRSGSPLDEFILLFFLFIFPDEIKSDLWFEWI